MEPVRSGGSIAGAVALTMAIVVAVLAFAMVGVGGGFTHPLMTHAGALAEGQTPPGQG